MDSSRGGTQWLEESNHAAQQKGDLHVDRSVGDIAELLAFRSRRRSSKQSTPASGEVAGFTVAEREVKGGERGEGRGSSTGVEQE